MHRYLRDIEEAVIRSIGAFGITGKRVEAVTGVWVDTPRGSEKICAIGVKVTRWITMHGFALNVNSNLDFFNNIIPCGITDKGVTSMQKISGKEFPLSDIQDRIITSFEEVFHVTSRITEKEYFNKMESYYEMQR